VVKLEEWMRLHELRQRGLSISEISRELGMDRKTVRKYLTGPPKTYQRNNITPVKLDSYKSYLRERWEQGVHNGAKLLGEIQKRGYSGGYTQLREWIKPWRSEERQRAYVRFETGPGEQSQLDWGHFGNWNGSRLYGLALTLCYSRMRYIEFTQKQDAETLMSCMVRAFHYFSGMTEVILTDNMKTIVEDRIDGQPKWNARFLDFASYYGFVPRACRPYRPETKGKIESTIKFVKGNFWPGLQFTTLEDLNQQARLWMEEVNGRVHATTREIPIARWAKEQLRSIDGQPDYDTSYVGFRQVSKDCLVSYRGNRYSVPHTFTGKMVAVKEPVRGGEIAIYHQHALLARHRLQNGRGALVMEPGHYQGLPGRRSIQPEPQVSEPAMRPAWTGPDVEIRPLAIYEEIGYGAAI